MYNIDYFRADLSDIDVCLRFLLYSSKLLIIFLSMIGFFIKKSFFDGWDNFLQLVLQNLVYTSLLIGAVALLYLLGTSQAVFYLLITLSFLVYSLLRGGTAEVCKNYSCYISETWKPFLKGIKRNFGHSLFFFLVLMILFFMVAFTIPFYSSFDSVMGLILSVVLFWVLLFFLFALPYYFPLMTHFPGDKSLKTFKKCLIVSFDNPGITLFLLIHILIDAAFSVVTAGLVPGLSGIMLSESDCMKLLMKKYDWLDENPDKNRKDINWDELLDEEKETIGPRSLKGMIFPWK